MRKKKRTYKQIKEPTCANNQFGVCKHGSRCRPGTCEDYEAIEEVF
jgi:hypothetical protein